MAGYYRRPKSIRRKTIRILAVLIQIVLTPLLLILRIYDWVWSIDYVELFKRL